MDRFLLLCGVLVFGLAACAGKPTVAPEKTTQAPSDVPSISVGDRDVRLLAAVNDDNSVFFAISSAVLNAAAEQKLQQHVLRLKADPKLVVRLLGYTDDLGSHAYNMAIAEQRVNAVYGFLRRSGVPARQLHRSGRAGDIGGKSCDSAECRAKMRRVELIYPAP